MKGAEAPGEQPERLEVGRIGKAHGLAGEVAVSFVTNRPERWSAGSALFVGDTRLVVKSARSHQDLQLIRFEGTTSREGAEALRGKVLTADPLDVDDVLWVHELIGAEVEEADGTPRGRVESVLDNPASDLLVLDTGALVPLTFVIDFEAPGPVVIEAPDGLFSFDGD